MSVKMSAARRAAFLRALKATGNQALAAERAKVSRRWVCLHRRIDPEFRRESDAAIAEAGASLSWAPGQARGARGSNRPPSGWGFLDGEELVVRGSNARRLQIARARMHQWTPRLEERFLEVLAETCNIKAACAAAGLSAASLSRHRKRWPGFDLRCRQALAIGYGRLDDTLKAEAIRMLDPDVPRLPPDVPVAPMTVDGAIHLVRIYEKRAREHGWRG